jgi:hypothetical protein
VSPYAWLAGRQLADGRIASPNDDFGINTFPTAQTVQAVSAQWHLRTEQRDLVAALAQRLAASSAAARTLGHATVGPNVSTRAARERTAHAVAMSQSGRETAAEALFQRAFERGLDAAGRAYWSGQLVHDSRSRVLVRLTGSPEFYARSGSTTAGFVDNAYRAVLGRGPDTAGKAYWSQRLDAGDPVSIIAADLVASREYRAKEVDIAYQQMLGRDSDAGVRSCWTERLATTRVEAILAGIGGSAEFTGATPDPAGGRVVSAPHSRPSGGWSARAVVAVVAALVALAGTAWVATPPAAAEATGGCRPLGGTAAATGGPHRATVVVDPGSGPVWSACISFAGTISGLDALELAAATIPGLEPVYEPYPGQGRAVCRLLGVGNDPPNCLGKSVEYWSYFRDGAYSRGGGGASQVSDGDVEGWSFSTGTAPRAATRGRGVPTSRPPRPRPRPRTTPTSPARRHRASHRARPRRERPGSATTETAADPGAPGSGAGHVPTTPRPPAPALMLVGTPPRRTARRRAPPTRPRRCRSAAP